MKISAEEARDRLDKARKLRTLNDHIGWLTLTEWFQLGLDRRRNRLCALDCGPEETTRLRIEMDCIRTLLTAPQISDEKIALYEERVAFASKQEKMRSDLGMSPDLQEQTS